MNHRHTLNGLTPRTVADAARDTRDWWEGSQERDFIAGIARPIYLKPSLWQRIVGRVRDWFRYGKRGF